MPKYKTAKETYEECEANGEFKKIMEVNIQKLKDLISNAETNISAAKILGKSIKKQDKEWMNVYIDHYEALRIYAEVLVKMDKMKISNHKCLFSYICKNYPRLEFDWDFLEKIRTKRNGANYYGETISYADWKAIELQLSIYISTLRKEVEKRMARLS